MNMALPLPTPATLMDEQQVRPEPYLSLVRLIDCRQK